METNSQIEADDQEFEVIAQADSCSKGNILGKAVEVEISSCPLWVSVEQPYVTCIQESSAIQIGDDGETVLYISFRSPIWSM